MKLDDNILDSMQRSIDAARTLQDDAAWWDEDEEAMELLEGLLSGVVLGFTDAAELSARLRKAFA